MKRRMGLIGVPSSAGTHWPGQEEAPRVLREAGLIEHPESVGPGVMDRADLPCFFAGSPKPSLAECIVQRPRKGERVWNARSSGLPGKGRD